MNRLLTFIILLSSLSVFGQITYQESISTTNSFRPMGVVTFDDNSSIIGNIDYQTAKIAFVKIDFKGDILWIKEIFTPDTDNYTAAPILFKTSDNKVIYEYSTQNGGAIIKTDSSCNVLWNKKYILGSNGFLMHINETSDKGLIFVGGGLGFTEVLKIDSSGNPTWCKSYSDDTLIIFSGQAIIQTDDGGYLVGGSYQNDQALDIYFTMKIDSSGNVIHAATTQTGRPVDANFFRTGVNNYFMPGNAFFMCFDSTGNLKWEKYITFYCGDEAIKPNKNIFCIGIIFDRQSNSYYGATDIDTVGNVVNCLKYDSPDQFVQYCADTFKDGSIISVGYLAHDNDIYVIKSDSVNISGCYEYPVTIYDSAVNDFTTPLTIIMASNSSTVSDLNVVLNSITFSDSTSCYNGPLSSDEILNSDTIYFTIFPNPATNQLTIHTSSFQNETVTVSVMNVLGEVMQVEKASPPPFPKERELTINIKNLSAGIYFLEMQNETGRWAGRFVKE